ncbi:hypothetical protein [Herbiconiux sp.]|uniref:hypothetical protein n=1 Tax=Herbiconiux sp. TaxID=1871186 RepID=UPI0025BF3837|nr:hypothetical protein [Herbiconiux sp.]
MRRTGGPIIVVLVPGLVLGLVGCAGAEEQQDRAAYDAMLEVEKVPGVIVAPYEDHVQIDPSAPEDEIVATALGVREVLDGLGSDRPEELTLVAVYPGDAVVATEFTTPILDDPDRLERDVRIWASLLDEGFTEVRFNVFDETGDGVLNVHSGEPGEPGPSVSESFDAMVGALSASGADSASFEALQTEALVDDTLVTNRSGRPALPADWAEAIEAVTDLAYIRKAAAGFEPDATTLRLTGSSELTPEQSAEILAILGGAGVLQPSVTVTYSLGGDTPATALYGSVQ